MSTAALTPFSPSAPWDAHYQRSRSEQEYPDENLVRLLAHAPNGPAFDLGAGSGRHIKLLSELGFSPVTAADVSESSVAMCRRLYPHARVMRLADTDFQDPAFRLPIPADYFQVVTAWGVIHYNDAAAVDVMLTEIKRVLALGGHFLGTLRAVGDTHLSENADLPDVQARYFSEDEARTLINQAFGNVELGYVERSPVGQLDRRICHWIFRAVKSA